LIEVRTIDALEWQAIMSKRQCFGFKHIAALCLLAVGSGCGGCAGCGPDTDPSDPLPNDGFDHGFPSWPEPSSQELAAREDRALELKAQREAIEEKVTSMAADSDGPTYAFESFGGLTSTLVLTPAFNMVKAADGSAGLILKSESGFSVPWTLVKGELVTDGVNLGGSVATPDDACPTCGAPPDAVNKNGTAGGLTIKNCDAYDPKDIEKEWYLAVERGDSCLAKGSDGLGTDDGAMRDKFMYFATVPAFEIICDDTMNVGKDPKSDDIVCGAIDNFFPCKGLYKIRFDPTVHTKYGGRCSWIGGTFFHEITHLFLPAHDPDDPCDTSKGWSRRICACQKLCAGLETERACCFDESETACATGTPGSIVAGKRYRVTLSSSRRGCPGRCWNSEWRLVESYAASTSESSVFFTPLSASS
jgi:hypothetical protein